MDIYERDAANWRTAGNLKPDLVINKYREYLALDPEIIRIKKVRERTWDGSDPVDTPQAVKEATKPLASYIPEHQPGGKRYAEFKRVQAARKKGGGIGRTRRGGI